MKAVLETARFQLQPIDVQDAGHRAVYIHLYTDPEVMAQIGPPLTPAAAERGFNRLCELTAGDRPGHCYWVIVERASNLVIGFAGFRRHDERAEIGAMLRKEWWRQGVATEAFAGMLEHAWTSMGLAAVFGESLEGHMPIVGALFERLGFHKAPNHSSASVRPRWVMVRPHESTAAAC